MTGRAEALLARGYTPERVAEILAAHGQPPPRCELCHAPILPPQKPIGRTMGACWCPDCIDGWQRR